MSISGRSRVALLLALLLTAVLVGVAVEARRVSRATELRLAASVQSLRHQEVADGELHRLRFDLGSNVRRAQLGKPVSNAPALAARLDALTAKALPEERAATAEVTASGKALLESTTRGDPSPDGVARYSVALGKLEQIRQATQRRLSVAAENSVRDGTAVIRLWALILSGFAALMAFSQIVFVLWLRRGIAQPLARLVALLRGEVDSAAPEDVARTDEIGTLTRATTDYLSAANERSKTAQQLAHALRHDSLTGLLSRQAFDEYLEKALGESDDGEIALFTLDLDRFKDINDTHGHAGGDAVLRQVAAVLKQVCDNGETVGRLGGDEFAIIRPGNRQVDGARQLSRRLIAAFEDAGIGVSIGVACFPQDASDETRLRHYSDLALYRAKHAGRGRACFFSSAQHQASKGTTGFVPLPSELREAIAAGDLRLHYQPKLRSRSGKVDSLEALVRWQHASRGLVAPDAFVPVAEKMGQIRSLTEWTLRRAIDDQTALAEAGHVQPIYVNISGCLLGDPDFARTALNIAATATGQLGFEITETAVIDDPEHALGNLERFAEAGIRIAIDDFGAGMSSLNYLKRLPAHELKIDRSFVADLSRSHRDPLIVRSTIDLAHALGLEVAAEGVEKLSSFALLRAMGCDLIQGFLVARPMPLDNLLAFLADEESLSHLGNIALDVRAAKGW